MKTKGFFIPVSLMLALLLCGCGRKKAEKKTETVTPQAVVSQNITEEAEEEAPQIISYKVILKEKTLSLYEVDGDNKKLITSIEINPDFYPEKDIRELKAGVEAYCKEDGYEILENFAN